jgi:membrane protease YdiL (CAAX protease family)
VTEPSQLPPAPHPRRGRIGTLIAWLLIIASVGYLAVGRAVYERAAAPPDHDPEPSFQVLFVGRYAVGVHALTSALGGPGTPRAATGPATVPARSPAADLLPQVDAAAEAAPSPGNRLRAAIVAGEVAGADAALKRLESSDAPQAGVLRALYRGGPDALPQDQRGNLVHDLGWFGELALVHGKPPGDPQRREVMRPALRTTWVAAAAGAAALAALVAGTIVLIVAIVLKSQGGLKFAYQRPPPDRPTGPFLEAFAAYLAGMVVISTAVSLLMERTVAATWFVVAVIPVVFVWPRLRGVPWRELRYGIGWTAGRGLFREAGAGILGYFAGLPLLAAGVLVTLLLQRFSGADTAHPIVNEIVKGGPWRIVQLFVLAAVWAPVVEETMFRGAFYHHLRRRLPWPAAAAAVGLLFAAVHPQGWAAIPALGAIGFSFATVREWRGSIVGPAVAHALNNGAVTLLELLMMG